MFVVHPVAGEQSYFRVLLTNVLGASSSESLRVARDGVPRSTFREAAAQRSLLADDTEWRNALRQVAANAPPKQLLEMFAYILVFRAVGSPLDFRTLFCVELAYDCRRAAGRPRPTEDRLFNEALIRIDSLPPVQGKSIRGKSLCYLRRKSIKATAPHGGGGRFAGSVNRVDFIGVDEAARGAATAALL